LSRKENGCAAEWSKGFGAKGLAVTKVTATGLDTGIAKVRAADRGEIDRAARGKEGDLLAFRAGRGRRSPPRIGRIAAQDGARPQLPASTGIRVGVGRQLPAVRYMTTRKAIHQHAHPFTAPLDEDLAKLDSREAPMSWSR